MMKKGKILSVFLATVGTIATALSFAACGEAPPTPKVLAEKTGDIPVVEKYFVSGKAESGKVDIDLTEYVDAKGTAVTYAVSSSSDSVNASVDGDMLSIGITGEAQSTVTVTVNSDGTEAFSLEVEVRPHQIKKVYCVGDSLTAGHDYASQAYPVYLNAALGDTVTVVNCGVNGAQATGYGGMGLDYKYDVNGETDKKYLMSVAPTPDVVAVMLGTNDATGWTALQNAIDKGTYSDKTVKTAAEAFEKCYTTLLEKYKTKFPSCAVIAIISPPTLPKNKFAIPNATIKEEVNPVQRKVIEELKVYSFDARALFEGKMTASDGEATEAYTALFRADGVHLSVEGAQMLANSVTEYIYTL